MEDDDDWGRWTASGLRAPAMTLQASMAAQDQEQQAGGALAPRPRAAPSAEAEEHWKSLEAKRDAKEAARLGPQVPRTKDRLGNEQRARAADCSAQS